MYSDFSVGRCVSKLSNQIRRRLDALALKSGISGSQGRVLHFILAQKEDVFQRDIEQEFNLRPPSASELLKQMEKNGFLHRESLARDGRLKRVVVTEQAAQMRETVFAELTALEQDLTRGISQEELQTFFKVAEQMSKNLKV